MSNDELHYLPAGELAAAIWQRDVSPVDAVDAALKRIERLNGTCNAFLTVREEEARAEAKQAEEAVVRGGELGPLHGVPISMKDLLYTAGLRTTGGSLTSESFVPDRDTPLVERLRQSGAIILGKTNTPEFGLMTTTENRLGPPCRNPWDPTRTSGGSSGGAGAAAALGMGNLHVGTDGGGSIRIPASLCGVFGLKPTIGRVPPYTKQWGGFGAWPTFAQAGPMTRTVLDAALLLDVIAGPAKGDPSALPAPARSFRPIGKERLGLKVAWSADLGFATVDPEVRALTEAAALRFRDLGCEVEEATPELDDGAIAGTFVSIAAPDEVAAHGALLEKQEDKLCDYTVRFLRAGENITADQRVEAQRKRTELWRTMDSFLSRYDLLLTPALATAAFPIDEPPATIDGREVRPGAWSPFLMISNLTGQPAASIPCGWTSAGLPVGLQMISRAFREELILEAAYAFERAQPWGERRPPISDDAEG